MPVELKNVVILEKYPPAWEAREFLKARGIQANIVQRFAIQVPKEQLDEAANQMAFYDRDWRGDGRYMKGES